MFALLCAACRYYLPQAWYKTTGAGTAWRTTIYLPPGASEHSSVVEGDFCTNGKSAKNSAALAAIRQLHAEGSMNGCLFPSWGNPRLARQLGESRKAPAGSSKQLLGATRRGG